MLVGEQNTVHSSLSLVAQLHWVFELFFELPFSAYHITRDSIYYLKGISVSGSTSASETDRAGSNPESLDLKVGLPIHLASDARDK